MTEALLSMLRAADAGLARCLIALRPCASAVSGRMARWSEFSLDLARRILIRAIEIVRLRRMAWLRRPVVLFLAPEAGLKPFFASHVVLAKTLQDSGFDSVILACNGLLPICSVKFAASVPATRPNDQDNAACLVCRQQRAATRQEYRIPEVLLEDLLDDRDREEIVGLIASHSGNLISLKYAGVPVGEFCIMEAMRPARKSDPSELNKDEHRLSESIAFSTLAVMKGARTLARSLKISRSLYFGDYAYWLSVQMMFKASGIPSLRISHVYGRDVDRRVITCHPESANTHLLDQFDQWPQIEGLAITPQTVASIAGDALYRLQSHGGLSTYSPKWSGSNDALHETLGLSRTRKTIVAYCSSSDEIVASRSILAAMGRPYSNGPRPFVDQAEWLRQLQEWVGDRAEYLQLVIRVHPRMAGNSRFASAAGEYEQFKKDLRVRPDNVAVIWAEDAVSSYNLAEIADVATIAWSTMGLELARFGVPVVAAFDGIGSFATGSFIKYDISSEGYFRKIEAAVGSAANLQDIAKAFRWTYFSFLAPGVDVSDVIPAPDFPDVPAWRMPAKQQAIVDVLAKKADMSFLNMGLLPQTVPAISAESDAIRRAIRRFVVFFLTGRDDSDFEAGEITSRGDDIVEYLVGDDVRLRYSPLARRLASLLQLP